VFSPLLFADWRAISRGATLVSWLAVAALVLVIASHFLQLSPGHLANHLSARR
jgi:hypothetical protein